MKKVGPYILLHLLFLMFSCADIVSKYAAGQEFLSLSFLLLYGTVLLILFLYAIFWQQILKKIPLITAYVNKAVTIIWGLIFGMILFDEHITIGKVCGAGLIIGGVIMVVKGDEKA